MHKLADIIYGIIKKYWPYVLATLATMKLIMVIWGSQVNWQAHWVELASHLDNKGEKITISQDSITGRLGFSPTLIITNMKIGSHFKLDDLEFKFGWFSWLRGVPKVKKMTVGGVTVSTAEPAGGYVYVAELENLVDLFYLFDFARLRIGNIHLDGYSLNIRDFNIVHTSSQEAEVTTRLGWGKILFPIKATLTRGSSGKWEGVASSSKIVGVTSQFKGKIEYDHEYPMLKGGWEFNSLDMPDLLRRMLGRSSLIPEGLRLDALYKLNIVATRSAIELSSKELTSGIVSGSLQASIDLEQQDLEIDAKLDHIYLPFVPLLKEASEHKVLASAIGEASPWNWDINFVVNKLTAKDLTWENFTFIGAKYGQEINLDKIYLDWQGHGKIMCTGHKAEEGQVAGKLGVELDNITSMVPNQLANQGKVFGLTNLERFVWHGDWKGDLKERSLRLASSDAILGSDPAQLDVFVKEGNTEANVRFKKLNLQADTRLEDWYGAFKESLSSEEEGKETLLVSADELCYGDKLLGRFNTKFTISSQQLLIDLLEISNGVDAVRMAGGLALYAIAPILKLDVVATSIDGGAIGKFNDWIVEHRDASSAIPFDLVNLPRLVLADVTIKANKLSLLGLEFDDATLNVTTKDNIYYFNRVEGDIYNGRVAFAGSFMPSSKASKFAFNGRNLLLSDFAPELSWFKVNALANISGNIATIGITPAEIKQNLTANLLVAAGPGTIISHNFPELAYATAEEVNMMLESLKPTYVSNMNSWLESHTSLNLKDYKVNGIEARLNISPTEVSLERLMWFDNLYKAEFTGKLDRAKSELDMSALVEFRPASVSPLYDYKVLYKGSMANPEVTFDYRSLLNNLRYKRIKDTKQ